MSESREPGTDARERIRRAVQKLREVDAALKEVRRSLPPEHPLRMKLLVPETMANMARLDLGDETVFPSEETSANAPG